MAGTNSVRSFFQEENGRVDRSRERCGCIILFHLRPLSLKTYRSVEALQGSESALGKSFEPCELLVRIFNSYHDWLSVHDSRLWRRSSAPGNNSPVQTSSKIVQSANKWHGSRIIASTAMSTIPSTRGICAPRGRRYL